MAAVSPQRMSDEALVAATGRTRAAWNDELDERGAREWPHPRIARWLVDELGIDGWWAQGITVAFEQAIGRRIPGQTADGTFSVSSSRTLAATRDGAVAKIIDQLVQRLGDPSAVTLSSLYSTARWKVDNGTIVAAVSGPKPDRTLVSLTFSRIVDPSGLDAAKERLKSLLDGMVL